MASCADYVKVPDRFECVECPEASRRVYPLKYQLQIHQFAFGHRAWRVVSEDADVVEWDNS